MGKMIEKEKVNLLTSLRDAIVEIDEEKSKARANQILAEKIDPLLAIKESIGQAAKIIGDKFESGELFLGHLVMAGDLMEEIAKILEKNIPIDQLEKKKIIVIATVQGDMHSIGKNLVSTMLKSTGFEVHDMGVDATSSAIIQKANEVKADMIALSSLLTTTMTYQKEVIDDLISMGLRNRFKVMIGGGPVTKEYAKSIGADGFAPDAIESVKEAKRLLSN